MERRQLLGLFGSAAIDTVLSTRSFGASPTPIDARDHLDRSLAAIAETMFPGDGSLASAAALGSHLGILEIPTLRQQTERGVKWLDVRASSLGAPDFRSLGQNRSVVLDEAFASRDDGIQAFVLSLRFHIGKAYYSSPVVKAAFAYTGPPQPDGFADFQQPPA